jgi:hypothetical protein
VYYIAQNHSLQPFHKLSAHDKYRETRHDWLRLAVSNGSTKWLRYFIQTYLSQLKDQQISAEAFAQALEAELEARQLDTPARQRNYRSNIAQALKSFDSSHPAIALVSLSTEQYRELNDIARGRLAERETRYLTSDQAAALVERSRSNSGGLRSLIVVRDSRSIYRSQE